MGEAKRLYTLILHSDPLNADALHLLGMVALQERNYDLAAELIRKAITQNSRMPAFHNNLGNVLREQGQLAEAVASYRRAVELKPDHIGALQNLGFALQAQDKPDAAIDVFRRVLKLKPDNVPSLLSLGNALQAQGKLDEAMAAYRQVISIKQDFAEAHNNIGSLFKLQGKLDDAAASYQRALAIRPDFAEAHYNLGLVFLVQSQLDDAARAFRKALSCRPNYVEAFKNLGTVLSELGCREEAVANFRQALAVQPDNAEAQLGLTVAVLPVFAETTSQSENATKEFARALDDLEAWCVTHREKLGKVIGSSQPFYLAYRPVDITALLSRYGDLVGTAATAYWQQHAAPPAAVRPSDDRIRMAIVTRNIRRNHPVWEIILRGIIAHYDRRRFHVCLYHTGSADDEEPAWAAGKVDRFVGGPKSTREWRNEIARDCPDILFYPEIGMDHTTGGLASLRLAPLQIASWGHPVTTGLPSIDLFVSGELLEGAHADSHYREKLVRLPGTGVCTERPPILPQPWNGPQRKANAVRVALCQQPIKFDPADDIVLARIAKACAHTEFWLAAPKKLHWATVKLRDRLAAAFRGEGLDPETRLHVMPWFVPGAFAGFLEEMDLYLDCPAFSGYTTAWQALHHGLPIVTLEGKFLRQRLAAGLLRQIGCTEGIASSRDDYVDIAIDWAHRVRNTEEWAARRDSIRLAAAKADGNRSAVTAFEQAVIDALRERG